MRLFLLIAVVNLFGKTFFNHFNSRCNVCNRKPWFWLPRGRMSSLFQEFQVIGAGYRFVDCPCCFSSDRDRLVYYFLKSHFEEKASFTKDILHVAPEKPIWKRWKRWNVRVTGIDKRTRGYKFTYSRDVLNADLTDLKFEENAFDMVVCNHVLEHIPDESKALQEIHRVLRIGGLAILQVPFSPIRTQKRVISKLFKRMKRIEWVGQHDHVRLYANKPWNDWLQYGFEFLPFEISPEVRMRHGMHATEPIMLLRKIQ